MELLPMNLSTFIKKAPIERADFIKIILGIAQGLNFLHKSTPTIIHRDLKPCNVLLDESLVPRIADFGVSREKMGATATMTRIGTPMYCAPEVLNNEHYSTSVDIYSYGMLVYVMTNRAAPWKKDNLTPIQIMMKVAIKKERPTIPSTCSPDIVHLITTCWDQDPKNRPTANDIITLLKYPNQPNSTISVKSKTTVDETKTNTSMPQGAKIVLSHVEGTQKLTGTQHVEATKHVEAVEATKHVEVTKNVEATQIVDVTSKQHGMVAQGTMSHVTKGGTKGGTNFSVSTQENTKKKVCMYDEECYRTNLSHFVQYSHPNRDAYEHFMYSMIKEMECIPPEVKQMLEQFRKAKGIPDRVHILLHEALGWSKKEFDNGKKENEKKKDKKSKKRER